MSFASDIGRMVARGPQRELNEQEILNLVQLTMICEEPEQGQIEFYREMCQKSQAMAILDARFRACLGNEVKFSPPLLIWLSTLADRPGNVVLLVAMLAHAILEGRELTFNSLLGSYFADGIPTSEAYRLAWDAQKANEERLKSIGVERQTGDNVLDYQEAWK